MTLRNAFADMATEESASDGATLLRRILLLLLAPLGYDKSLRRYRQTTVIESGTLTTCNTVSNLVSIDGRPGAMLINAQCRQSWALNVRSRIT